ncbi:ferritin-like domain-containing protein [Halobellus litoreus]|uniref:Ferritin-like domain-containing protein n=1 Tax=Halobellus litoreus TaxID=755310 RepID=A0ABD6DRA6_9EURY
MSVGHQVTSDHQLARLLQIGIVLEEVVEARSYHHYQSLDDAPKLDSEIETLLEHAASESAEHRERLEALVDELDAESIPFDEIEALVQAQYGGTEPEDFDDILYDQLCNEETAYKFYDDLIGALRASEATFGIDRDRLIDTLVEIREEEAEGVEEVTKVMNDRQ